LSTRLLIIGTLASILAIFFFQKKILVNHSLKQLPESSFQPTVVKGPKQVKAIKKKEIDLQENKIPLCEFDEDNLDSVLEINKEELESIYLNFQDSSKVHEGLFYSLTSPAPSSHSRIDLLNAFNHQFKGHKLSYWKLLTECSDKINSVQCDNTLLSEIEKFDTSNTATLIGLANIYAQRGSVEKVISSMEKALNAVDYKEYYYEQLAFFEEILAYSTSLNFKDRINFGLFHVEHRPMIPLSMFCEKNSPLDSDIYHLCVNVGERMERRGSTISTIKDGMYLQRISHLSTGKKALSKTVEKRLQVITNKTNSSNTYRSLLLLQHDESLLKNWLINLQSFDEVQVIEKLEEEVLLLSQDKYYNPCR